MAFSPVSHVIFCALITYFCLGYVLGYVVMDVIIKKKLVTATNFIRISIEWTGSNHLEQMQKEKHRS